MNVVYIHAQGVIIIDIVLSLTIVTIAFTLYSIIMHPEGAKCFFSLEILDQQFNIYPSKLLYGKKGWPTKKHHPKKTASIFPDDDEAVLVR